MMYQIADICRRTLRLSSWAVFLLLAAQPLASAAQAGGRLEPESPESPWSAVIALTAGQPVRIRLRAGRTYRGEIAGADADGVRLLVSDSETRLARTDVLTLAVRARRRRARNIALGTGAGLAAGMVYCAAMGRRILGCRDTTPPAKGWVVSLSFFGALGALTGAVLPSGGWRIIYRAAQQRTPATR